MTDDPLYSTTQESKETEEMYELSTHLPVPLHPRGNQDGNGISLVSLLFER